MPSDTVRGSLKRGLATLATPGMYLLHKYTQYKRSHQESQRKKATEKELQCLHLKIDKLLSDLDENDSVVPCSEEEECVVCLSAKATMQTFPCGHMVVCRKCFVKTIQVAVSQRCLPLLCVVCRTKIYRLKQAGHSPPLTPPPSRPHFQFPWQNDRSRSPPARRRYGRGSGQRSSSLARQLFGGRIDSSPSNFGMHHPKTLGGDAKIGASQSKPVATKLMKPLLIYPSDRHVPSQAQGFFAAMPSALKRDNGDTEKNGHGKKQVRFASPLQSHRSPVRLVCEPGHHPNIKPSSSPGCEKAIGEDLSRGKRLSSAMTYADCLNPHLEMAQRDAIATPASFQDSLKCHPYKSINKVLACAE